MNRPPTGARRLLRRLVEVVAEPISPQQRLDQIVRMIAADLVAEVCSLYAQRAGDMLELFATVGLAQQSVHHTRLRIGEGLVGTIAATGDIINTNDAQNHPKFALRPETGEQAYHSFLGVPIQRAGRVVGVLTVQNTAKRKYDEDEIEAMQIIASLLAEMLAAGNIIDPAKYSDLWGVVPEQRRFEGLRLVEGVAIGKAWLHEPRVEIERLLADDPAQERARLDTAMASLRESLDTMLSSSELAAGEHREVLEAYRMLAQGSGWRRRIREAIDTGLSAEAAVRHVQEETRVRIGHASDAYQKERLLDLDDLANRLLLHLSGRQMAHDPEALPDDVVLVARNLSAADLIEFDRRKLKGIVVEEGSKTAHVTIVARALDVPMIGRIEGAMSLIQTGDTIAMDGTNGQVFLRPGEEVLQAFAQTVHAHKERKKELATLKELPSVTRDGIRISIAINAAFLADLGELAASGIDGIGLYRTELGFMTRAHFPTVEEQEAMYRKVLDQAGGKRVIFRTLDVGSDKHLPYWRMPHEENPAMGWRALRVSLDRPAILRGQIRALVAAAGGRELSLMFPMVADYQEFAAADRLLHQELARAERQGRVLPSVVEVGAMFEVPALFWQLEALLPRVRFLSVGSNDLVQFLFACDRGNPTLTDRYDVLAPSVLACVRDLIERCRAAGVRLCVCGEMASRPLEAMALVGLGIRDLSLAASEIGSVKAMVHSLDGLALANYLQTLLEEPDRGLRERSLRGRLQAWAQDHRVVLPPSVYRPY